MRPLTQIPDPLSHLSKPPSERRAKGEDTKGGQDAEQDGDGLAQANRTRDRRAGQDERGEKADLDAIRLVVLDAIGTDGVYLGFPAIAVSIYPQEA